MGAPQRDSPPQPPHARFAGVVHGLAVLLLPAVAILLYRPGADGPLVFDDYNTIYYNFRIQTLRPLSQFLGSARPLTDLSYAIDFARGGVATRGYHVTNIAIHALTGLLVYALGFVTLGLRGGRFADASVRALVALAAAALFVAHPLQTEVVAYISSRSEGLAGLFYVLAVLLFAIATTTPRRWARRTSTAALPVVVAAGLASKEIAVTIPVALLLYDWCFLAGRRQPRPGLHWGLVALAASPLLLGVPVLLSGVVSRGTETTAGFGFDRFTPWQYLGTQFGVVLHYVRLIVAPIGLCLDYDWPAARSPLVGPLLLLAVGLWALIELVQSRVGGARWIRSVAYGLVAVLAVGALARLTVARVRLWADPVALYQDGVERAPANPRAWLNLGATHVAAGRFDLALPALQEAERLYARGESVHAFDRVGAYIHYNLGVIAYQQRRYAEAQTHLTQSRALGPKYIGLLPMTSLYLGHLALLAKDWPTAIARFEEALRYGNLEIRGLILPYLARAHARLGQYDQARARLAEVLREDPNNQQAHRVMQELGGQ